VSGYLTLTHFFSVDPSSITLNHKLPKTGFFGLHFVEDSMALTSYFNQCDVIETQMS